jgi:uncharacterized protein
MSTQRKQIVADLHTPEELLHSAQALLDTGDNQLMRAVVLEANAALETFVKRTVFGALRGKMDERLVKLLEDKTKMDLDNRLNPLASIATGQNVTSGGALWENYKKARNIRNEVVHNGRKVAIDDAQFVLSTVYEWLAFLGSTAEVEVALLGLKARFEKSPVIIDNELDATRIILDYFQSTKAATGTLEVMLSRGHRADLILQFGKFTVLIETKFITDSINLDSILENAIRQVSQMLNQSAISRGVIVLFHRGPIPEVYASSRTFDDGKVLMVLIQTT